MRADTLAYGTGCCYNSQIMFILVEASEKASLKTDFNVCEI